MFLDGGLSIFCPGQLNHPEGVAVDASGYIWAGGAEGEVYRIRGDIFVVPFAKLTGRLLGVTSGSRNSVLFCSPRHHAVMQVSPDGSASAYGPTDIVLPNCCIFDNEGRLY